jgi:hypothetical protein
MNTQVKKQHLTVLYREAVGAARILVADRDVQPRSGADQDRDRPARVPGFSGAAPLSEPV